MNQTEPTCCLDSNVLIQAWQKYYSPKYCPSYWDVLNKLGNEDRIFIPSMVYDEIVKTDDELSDWLKSSDIKVKPITSDVTQILTSIYAADPNHKHLVDSKKGRSLADPWVIAHAIKENAIVVTKEEKVTALNSTKIKIPNVCDNMGVAWINDYKMIEQLELKFSCSK